MQMSYPDGEVLTYHYDSGGLVNAAAGVKSGVRTDYLRRLEYDKFEEFKGARLELIFDEAIINLKKRGSSNGVKSCINASATPNQLKGPGSNYFSSARITIPTPPASRPPAPIHRVEPSACRAAWPPVFAPSWPQCGRGSASCPAAGSD